MIRGIVGAIPCGRPVADGRRGIVGAIPCGRPHFLDSRQENNVTQMIRGIVGAIPLWSPCGK